MINFPTKPASEDETSLYCLIGEAICTIQSLEGALSTSITLKKDVKRPNSISMATAKTYLEKYQSCTLGKAIKIANENSLYSDVLYNDLKTFLEERNWLIHKFLHHNFEDIHTTSTKNKLFHRIKSISNKAKTLQTIIEDDLIKFSESVGKDMSRVRAYMKENSQ